MLRQLAAVLLLALLAATAEAATTNHTVPDCSRWYAGSKKACPATCRAYDSPDGPVLANHTQCLQCTSGFSYPLSCNQCKLRHVHMYFDDYRQECLNVAALGCTVARLAPTKISPRPLQGPCMRCDKFKVAVWATARGVDILGFPLLPPGEGVQSAAAGHSKPREVSPYAPAPSNDGRVQAAAADPSNTTTDLRIWAAHRICLSGAQLGCPGKAAFGRGCIECPKGSVLLQTGLPAQADTFEGEIQNGWVFGYFAAKAPVLPSICLRIKQDLNCLPGKRRKGKGCTDKCPPGTSLQTPKPIYLAGSQSLQFQVLGKACL